MSTDGVATTTISAQAAAWALRVLVEYTNRLHRNGLADPPHAGEIFRLLATFADVEPPMSSASGTTAGNVVDGVRHTVAAAAEIAQCSPSYVRRLARKGQIRCRRVGATTWLIDTDSLLTVLRKARP